MVEIRREGHGVRVVLVDGDSREAAPIVSEVLQVLYEDGLSDVVIDIPGADLPDRAVISEVLESLHDEASERGVAVRFNL